MKMKRPHLKIHSVGSDLGLETKAVAEQGDDTDDEEGGPRDGPENKYE